MCNNTVLNLMIIVPFRRYHNACQITRGLFTKDVRAEGGRGVSEIRTNSDIGRGGLTQRPARLSLKKQEQKTYLLLWNKKILTVK